MNGQCKQSQPAFPMSESERALEERLCKIENELKNKDDIAKGLNRLCKIMAKIGQQLCFIESAIRGINDTSYSLNDDIIEEWDKYIK